MALMGENLHRKKLFGGRMTAHEIHVKYAWHGRKCDGCGAPPAMRIQIFVALSDMEVKLREAVQVEIALRRVATKMTVLGTAVRTSFVHACAACGPAAERAAARGPSYAMVDIDRGPGPDRQVVGVIAAP
jgi:hypothetical protein